MSSQRTPRGPSPFGLIQEELRDDPWRLLIACICLNLTNIRQVRPVIVGLFEAYPSPELVVGGSEVQIAGLIRTLGLHNRRARSIVRMSQAYVMGFTDVRQLPGVGKYAADSHRIFCEGRLDDVEPTDKKLLKYLEWARQ